MKPQNFEDIIAAISLYRPGPMDSIPAISRAKITRMPFTTCIPSSSLFWMSPMAAWSIRSRSCRLSAIWRAIRMARSDLVRRAMAKKKHDVMAKRRRNLHQRSGRGRKNRRTRLCAQRCERRNRQPVFRRNDRFRVLRIQQIPYGGLRRSRCAHGLAQAPLPGAVLRRAAQFRLFRQRQGCRIFAVLPQARHSRSSRRISIRACANSLSAKMRKA